VGRGRVPTTISTEPIARHSTLHHPLLWKCQTDHSTFDCPFLPCTILLHPKYHWQQLVERQQLWQASSFDFASCHCVSFNMSPVHQTPFAGWKASDELCTRELFCRWLGNTRDDFRTVDECGLDYPWRHMHAALQDLATFVWDGRCN
jgi:hypothetical protein